MECAYRDRHSTSLRVAQLAIHVGCRANTTGRPVTQFVLGHAAHRTGHEEGGVVSGLKPGLFFRVEGVHCFHEVSTLTQGTTQQLNSLVAQEVQGRTNVPRSQ